MALAVEQICVSPTAIETLIHFVLQQQKVQHKEYHFVIINTKIEGLLTPALLVDLNIMESNLQIMADYFKDRRCRLRPHFKNHKCTELAKKQLTAGAIGISAATLFETEILVNAGINSILICNEITGDANLKKLIELAENTNIIAAVDNKKIVDDIARLSANKTNKLSLVVDVDLGLKRCGVQPENAGSLAKKIIVKGLRFDGLMGYEGHLQRLDKTDINKEIQHNTLQILGDIRKQLEAENIVVNIVSAAGSGTFSVAANMKGITEVQAGNYLLMDTSYAPFAPEFTPSLSLLTTIISITPKERFVINTGIKEISAERGMPSLKNIQGATLKALHAEHGIVEIEDASLNVEVGDNIELNIFYSDGTVNLHNKMYGIRNGVVEKVFEISH